MEERSKSWTILECAWSKLGKLWELYLSYGGKATARRQPYVEYPEALRRGQAVSGPVLPQYGDTVRVAGSHQHAGAHVTLQNEFTFVHAFTGVINFFILIYFVHNFIWN